MVLDENGFQVIFDYRTNGTTTTTLGRTRSKKAQTKSTQSVELAPWLLLKENQEKIYDKRLFYALKANSEDVVKFGVAGTTGKSGANGRLRQYLHTYGESEDMNRCMGVQLLYLAGNKYNPEVQLKDSDVYKKELACKKYFRAPEVDAHLIGRGYERINKDRIQELFDIIDDPSNKDFGDTETTRRVQQQRGQQKLIETDYIVKITAHTTEGGKSRKKTRYSCYWNRPTILTKEKLLKKLHVNPRKSADIRDGQDDDRRRFETQQIEYVEDYITKQMFSEILSFTDGPKQLDIYKALHPTAVFRD